MRLCVLGRGRASLLNSVHGTIRMSREYVIYCARLHGAAAEPPAGASSNSAPLSTFFM